MKTPSRIQPLIEEGIVDEVLSQLLSGKEANVYLVRCGDDIRCAKVYKEAHKRSFKKAALYQEGRSVRDSRRTRAMGKKSNFGQQEQEDVWQSAEVDALYKLDAAGVRVPKPYGCFYGVLIMELICDEYGQAAPRLNDISMNQEQAIHDHALMIRNIIKMLAVGLVHGDLSEFNILNDSQGPVIIDLPQVVDALANNNAKWMFERDVNNVRNYYGQFAPELLKTQYAKEIWAIFETGELSINTDVTGVFKETNTKVDLDIVLGEIQTAEHEHLMRLQRLKNLQTED